MSPQEIFRNTKEKENKLCDIVENDFLFNENEIVEMITYLLINET